MGNSGRRLYVVVERGYQDDRAIHPKVAEYLHISEAFEHAAEFDPIHSHYDFVAPSYSRLVKTPVVTTIHGSSSPKIMPVFEKYSDGSFVSIAESDRAPGLSYVAAVYNGIDERAATGNGCFLGGFIQTKRCIRRSRSGGRGFWRTMSRKRRGPQAESAGAISEREGKWGS